MVRRQLAVLGVFAVLASAFIVVSAGPAGAVDVGNSADFITSFTNGTVGEIALTADITLTAEPGRPAGAVPLVINGNGFTLRQGAVGRVFSGQTNPGALTLRDITITGGNGNTTGGGFRWDDANLIVEGATITGNDATNNGGGFLSTGVTTITNSTITDNSSGLTDGGGVRAFGTSLVVTNSVISDNDSAQNGGAIGADGDVTITDSTISGNDAAQSGGAIAADGDVAITNSTITDNSATAGSGGGVTFGDVLTVTSSNVSGNDAAQSGGGVNSGSGSAVLTITDSTISDNTADDGGAVNIGGGSTTLSITSSTLGGNTATNGGAVNVGGGGSDVTFTNSTVSGNTGTSFGGGINAGGGDSALTLTYSTIVQNTSPDAANVGFGGPVTASAFGTVVGSPLGGGTSCNSDQIVSGGYNYEAGGNTCNFTAPTDVTDGTDPDLGALASNGGPTQTRLPAPGSPLIDKIPAASPCGGVDIVVDQRGLPRPVTAGQLCDIGSVEVQVVPIETRITFTG